MWYAIISEDITNSLPRRRLAREAHVARLQTLAEQDRLLIAGPHPAGESGEDGFTGSLVVARFDSLSAAQTWADADPYVDAGVYERVTIKPFKLVLP